MQEFHKVEYSEKCGHRIILVTMPEEWRPTPYEHQLRSALGAMNWQLVSCELGESGFGMAPLMFIDCPEHGYHATLKQRVPEIFKEGLKPSNAKRGVTRYPDTEGKIHLCRTLEGGDGSARYWVKIIADELEEPETNFTILKVNLTGVRGRVYRDVRSDSGFIIDGVESIAQVTLAEGGEG